ncbi:hypothetical protein BOX15_Mlig034486g1 [Macrostomum lignano]|uniref:Reverse transcriptase n=1 Tax=Macrostomum lignano TaxID=282301 RepID=A0A267F699_9PLAT|nr:hypothetical protein BOX15_Mlig034486g1 [Macrostomum lignano]
MATGLLCSIGPFEPENEDWLQYKERVEQVFIASDIESEDKKRAVFLSVCGKETFKLICSLLAPRKPSETSYADICQKLKEHWKPEPSEIVQRFHFYQRVRASTESVADFLASLRRLAVDCKFGNSLESMLRDRLVLGIQDDRIQRRLLSEPELDLEKALKIAQAVELAEKGCTVVRSSQEVAGPAAAASVDRVDQAKATGSGRAPQKCFRCLSTRHLADKCPFIKKACFKCGKLGHTAAACRRGAGASGADSKPRVGAVQEAEDEDCSSLNTVPSVAAKVPPYLTKVLINGVSCQMEIDTGAAVSLISAKVYQDLLGGIPKLGGTTIRLRNYGGQPVNVLGQLSVTVEIPGNEKKLLPLVVVSGSGSSLIGRNWLSELTMDWRSIKELRERELPAQGNQQVEQLLQKYSAVFSDGLGCYTGEPLKLRTKPGAQPKFFKARTVPFALKSKVEEQLDREIEQGVLQPVSNSEYASPIVPVLKADGSVRICADFKRTVNQDVVQDSYPLPRIEELFAKLTGGQKFTKLDLSQAYQQLPLDSESQRLCTINTSKGLLRYTRLPFGISPAVGMFQRTMDGLLQGRPHTAAFIDDLLVTGTDDAKHLENLEAVLQRLQDAGLKCRADKCRFMQESVSYLGHRIDAGGLHPLESKVSAIVEAPAPQDVTQLRSFLGLINYYGRFLPNLSSLLAPLHRLLDKGAVWQWNSPQESAFHRCKELLLSSQTLVHFDPGKEVILECDSSPYGLGAVICHLIDGVERPISFASRTLADAEKNYSQTEKEALAVVFGVKRFHTYLYGRNFQLKSDHKPLLGLLHENKAIPPLASARIQRWALLLSSYSYRLQYRKGATLLRADALSRLPLPSKPAEAPAPAEVVLLIDSFNEGPVTAAQVRCWTRRDPLLGRVLRFVQEGWPEDRRGSEDLRPFASRAAELSVEDGCLLWGTRVVVPVQGRLALLECLHQSHLGASKLKSLARNYFWWPGMDGDIERLSQHCRQCKLHQHSPPPAPLQPWPWPDRPWSRVHMDYAGPFEGKMLLILVDAHSKWIEVHICQSATSSATIDRLRRTFSQLGLPEVVVTDNGPNFVSQEMESFMSSNGIRHVKVSPYHPASNGLAERAVQTVKAALAKGQPAALQTRLARFLLTYRVTPHSTTGVPPSQLMMGRPLRTLLDLVRPDVSAAVTRRQEAQKLQHDRRARARSFEEGDDVVVRDFTGQQKWLPASISRQTAPLSYECRLPDDRIVRRHADHVASAGVEPLTSGSTELPINDELRYESAEAEVPPLLPPTPRPPTQPPTAPPPPTQPPLPPTPQARRSQRNRKCPDRLTYK